MSLSMSSDFAKLRFAPTQTTPEAPVKPIYDVLFSVDKTAMKSALAEIGES